MMEWTKTVLFARNGRALDTLIDLNLPLYSNGNGGLYVQLTDNQANEILVDQPNGSFSENFNYALGTIGFNYLFDGQDTWYRQTTNLEQETLLASAARTANVNSSDKYNVNCKGGHFIIDVTAISATPSITVTLQGKAVTSSKYYDLLTSEAITAVGTYVLKLYPGINSIPNNAASDILPRTYRVAVTHADSDSITYSIEANLIV